MFVVSPLANDANKNLEQLYSRINKSVFLTEPMRQTDAAFDAELTKIRNGDGDEATSDYFSGRYWPTCSHRNRCETLSLLHVSTLQTKPSTPTTLNVLSSID